MGVDSGSREVAHFDLEHEALHVIDAGTAGSLTDPVFPGRGTEAVAREYHIVGIATGDDPGARPVTVRVLAGGVEGQPSPDPADWLTPESAARRVVEVVGELEGPRPEPPRPLEIEFGGTTALDAADRAFIERVAHALARDVSITVPGDAAGR